MMARSLIALSLIALSFLKPAAAAPYDNDKSLMCTHLCFNKYGDDSQACYDKCYKSERPSGQEAHQCFSCIEGCIDSFSDPDPNLVMLRECKEGCVNHYFPNFNTEFKVRRDVKLTTAIPLDDNDSDSYSDDDDVVEHLPGLPKILSKLLAEVPYPVEADICAISCRVKYQDTIFSDPEDVMSCRQSCLANPTDRDRALQASKDCGTPFSCARKIKTEDDTTSSASATPVPTNTAANVTTTNIAMEQISTANIDLLVKRSTADDQCMVTCFQSMYEQRVAHPLDFKTTFDAIHDNRSTTSTTLGGKSSFAGKTQNAGSLQGSKDSGSNGTIKTFALPGGDESKSGAFMKSSSIFFNVIGTLIVAMASTI